VPDADEENECALTSSDPGIHVVRGINLFEHPDGPALVRGDGARSPSDVADRSDPTPVPSSVEGGTGPAEKTPTAGPRPYYVPVANEEHVFKAAFRQGLSVVLKGPTGCGKTRFLEAMAYDLERPLITVACHDDLTTADLVDTGRA
jgi:hypothetical protein